MTGVTSQAAPEEISGARSARSPESGAVLDMYLSWTGARIKGEPQDDESWGHLTREPRGVDYAETDAAAAAAMWAVPHGCADDRVLLCLHGGGFIAGSIYTHRKLYGHLAKAAGVRALIITYPFAPARTHPAQVDAVTAAYRWLLDQGLDPAHVALAGDSAGGGLAITAQQRARQQGLPVPAAALALSPWVDMEVIGDSYESNRATDGFFYKEVVTGLAALFLGEDGDPRDPLANPLYAELEDLAPLYIQAGGDETLLDDARGLAGRARTAGVEVKLDVFAGQQHTFQIAAGRAPEADDAIQRLAEWVRPRLGLDGRARSIRAGAAAAPAS